MKNSRSATRAHGASLARSGPVSATRGTANSPEGSASSASSSRVSRANTQARARETQQRQQQPHRQHNSSRLATAGARAGDSDGEEGDGEDEEGSNDEDGDESSQGSALQELDEHLIDSWETESTLADVIEELMETRDGSEGKYSYNRPFLTSSCPLFFFFFPILFWGPFIFPCYNDNVD